MRTGGAEIAEGDEGARWDKRDKGLEVENVKSRTYVGKVYISSQEGFASWRYNNLDWVSRNLSK
jgi:hypothetical protein